MQIVRSAPWYVNFQRFFANVAAFDNPLASTYSSDNFFPTFSHAPRYLCKFSVVFFNSFFDREIYTFDRPPTH